MLTHRPEAFTFLLRSTTRQHTRAGLRLLLSTVVVLVVALLLALILLRWPRPVPLPPAFTEIFLVVPLTFLVALWFSVLFHELGHAVAGRLADFDLIFLEVFFLRLARTPAGFRWQYHQSRGSLLRGLTVMIPRDYTDLRRRLLLFYAGGSLATALQLLLTAGLSLALAGRTVPFWVDRSLIIFLAMGLFFLLLTLIPLSGITDGARILALARGSTNIDYQTAIMVYTQSVLAGRLTREHDRDLIHRLLTAARTSEERLNANLIAYGVVLDQGHVAQAAAYLDGALSVLLEGQDPLPLGPLVFWEAAYLVARYEHDAAGGRAWAELAEKGKASPLATDMRTSAFRAQAALAFAENRPDEGLQYTADALALLADHVNQGGAESEKEWLLAMVAEAAPESLDMDGQLLIPSSTRRRTTYPLLKSAARFVLLVFGLMMVGGCLGLAVATLF